MNDYKTELLARFKCQQSGNCCRIEGVVYATAPEIEEMARCLDVPLTDFMSRYTQRRHGWTVVSDTKFRPLCFLNDKDGCSVYEARPSQCRTYPNWPEIWASHESMLQELTLCPGLKLAYDQFVTAKKESND